jgi:microcompartment protein CcmK/EutM
LETVDGSVICQQMRMMDLKEVKLMLLENTGIEGHDLKQYL